MSLAFYKLFNLKNVAVSRTLKETGSRDSMTWRTVPNGSLSGEVTIEIDAALLQRMAEKALKSRSRKAIIGNGLIVAKARQVKHEGGHS